jgi:DNA-directed RNA polymerase specialized sigma24 family protein
MLGRDPLADPQPLIRRVYAYVAYRVGDGPDAQDLTSEVFERALRYRDSFDSSRGSPAAWLIGIARRVLGGIPPVEYDLGDVPETASSLDVDDVVAERLDVAALVRRLDERDRELVALRYGADLSCRQIGELIGMRTNSVEVALHRALARLRALVDEDDERAAKQPRRRAV